MHKIMESLESYLRDSSGWMVKEVIHLEIHCVKYTPLKISSYIDLPSTLRQSRCILNVRNSDSKCFAWSILSSIHPVDNNPTHVSNYEPYEHELNMHGISYPIELSKN